jgi:hypothetical protein
LLAPDVAMAAGRAVSAPVAPRIQTELRFNLDEAQFAKANLALLAQGYRLADLSVFGAGPRLVLAGIWERHAGDAPAPPARVAQLALLQHLRLTRGELDALGEKQIAQRSVPEIIEGYHLGGALYFAAVFSPPDGPVMGRASPAKLRSDLGQAQKDARTAGLELARVDVYGDKGQVWFNPVFVPGPTVKRQSSFGLDAVAFGAKADALVLEHARPLSISAYDDGAGGPTLLYAGVFDPPGTPARVLALDQTPAQFQAELERQRKAGRRIIDIDGGATTPQDIRYSAVFEAQPAPASTQLRRLGSDRVRAPIALVRQ